MKNHHWALAKPQSNDFTNEIYISQIGTLYQQMPIVLTVNALNSSLVAVVLASYMGQALWIIFSRVDVAFDRGTHDWLESLLVSRGGSSIDTEMGDYRNDGIWIVGLTLGRGKCSIAP